MNEPPIIYVAHSAEQANMVLLHVGRLHAMGAAEVTVTAAEDDRSAVIVRGRTGRHSHQVVISAAGTRIRQ